MPRAGNAVWVLGLSVSHNGSACLMRDGEVIVAIQEERLTRRKRSRIDLDQPSLAVAYCLDTAGIGPSDLDAVVVCSQSELPDNCSPLLEDQLHVFANGTRVSRLGHHAGHMYSAIALSGFRSCAGLVVDALGSPARDLPENEKAACGADAASGSESISLYM
jgi:carbamoyltransferase